MFAAQIKKKNSTVLKQLIIPLPDFQESSHINFRGIDRSLTWCELLKLVLAVFEKTSLLCRLSQLSDVRVLWANQLWEFFGFCLFRK